MTVKTIELKEQGSLEGAKLQVYILDTSENYQKGLRRPLVLICPGGGYERTSDREAEPVAMRFLAMGYHAAVLRYSCAPARFPTALLELGRSVLLLREHAEEWKIEAEKIFIQGSSAGGHLAACLGVFWNREFLAEALQTERALLRPAGLILSYPVITAQKGLAHEGSFENLLGERTEEKQKLLSLEHQVTAEVPPCFLWHTYTDGTVPAENSLLFVTALKQAGVLAEFHLYPEGEHGLSLGDETTMHENGERYCRYVQDWIKLAEKWMKKMTVV